MNTQNEREAFEKVFSEIWIGYSLDKNADGTYLYLHAANQYRLWQHQQEIITNLEEKLQQIVADNVQLQAQLNEKDNFIKLMDVFGGYEKLQAQLTIAVNVLEFYAKLKGLGFVCKKATEALAEINRLQDKPAEGE
jgi:hypothetical protein